MTYPVAYIRVAIVEEHRGIAKCLPVNEQGEAFDGVGPFRAGHITVHKDAVASSPIDQEVDGCAIYYGGHPQNREAMIERSAKKRKRKK